LTIGASILSPTPATSTSHITESSAEVAILEPPAALEEPPAPGVLYLMPASNQAQSAADTPILTFQEQRQEQSEMLFLKRETEQGTMLYIIPIAANQDPGQLENGQLQNYVIPVANQDTGQPRNDVVQEEGNEVQEAQGNTEQPKNQMWQCQHCNVLRHSKASIGRHLQKVHGEQVISCTKCDYITNKQRLMIHHLKKDHKLDGSWAVPRQCRMCSTCFVLEASLAWHEETAHLSNLKPTKTAIEQERAVFNQFPISKTVNLKMFCPRTEAETRELSVNEKNPDMTIPAARTSEGNLSVETLAGQVIAVSNQETQDDLFGQLENNLQVAHGNPVQPSDKSTMWQCKYCNVWKHSKESIGRHLQKVHGNYDIRCTICDYITREGIHQLFILI
jgi:uncharacterized C2H2 Zn-finger protein